MVVRTKIKKSEYHDSVNLMLLARELSNIEGIDDAAVMMGTDANKEPGVGMVGAGILRAPEKCFADAFNALQEICNGKGETRENY